MSANQPEKSPMRADARRNRDAIVRTAARHFDAHGVNASLDEIARDAGIGPGTLYRHFPTREHLLCEVLQGREEVLLSRRDEAAEMPRAEDALRAWMLALRDYLTAFNGLPKPFLDAIEAHQSPLAVTSRTLIDITGEFLARAQQAGVARKSVSAPTLLISALGAAFVHETAGKYGTNPESIEEIIALGYLTDGAASNAATSNQ